MIHAIHRAAAEGFGAAAASYEVGRPAYPPDAIDPIAAALDVGPGRTVLDLGAGTGKLTRLLEPLGVSLVAVEPVDAMRAESRERSPGVRALGGTAEAIPLETASVDAVVAAQAFHWFEGDRALPEIHRVLRPGGRLSLVWNVRDETTDWVARITDIVDPYAAHTPRHRNGAWRDAFERTELFGELELRRFPSSHEMTPEQLVDRVLSTSFIAALGEAERARVANRVRDLAATHGELVGRDWFAFPYVTDVWWCERL